jgi:NADH-quinone oxidoreductase subunit M
MIPSLSFLSMLLGLPLIGILFIAAIPEKQELESVNAKVVALWISLVTLGLALILTCLYNTGIGGYQFIEFFTISKQFQLDYYLGVDGLSLALIVLTTILIPLSLLSAWDQVYKQARLFSGLFLLLEFCLIGSFVSLNSIFFYIFFEASLIPLFLLIGLWGGENRIYAAFKMFIYAVVGSICLLIGLLSLSSLVGTFNIPDLVLHSIPLETQKYLWWLFIIGFMIKIPMWPLHNWLPDAHVQAPTAASMILAGIVLKLGAYGILRFSIPIFPTLAEYYAPSFIILGLIAIIYIACVAFAQIDMKKLIAYASVSHMGYVTIGIFSGIKAGILGAMMQMISHGIISAGLFFCVGILYQRGGTLKISNFGGVAQKMPIFGGLLLLLSFAAIAVPGTSGFWGEFLVLVILAKINFLWAILGALGVILAPVYMLWFYNRVMWGSVKNTVIAEWQDISLKDKCCLLIFVLLVLGIGLCPQPIFQFLSAAFVNIVPS